MKLDVGFRGVQVSSNVAANQNDSRHCMADNNKLELVVEVDVNKALGEYAGISILRAADFLQRLRE